MSLNHTPITKELADYIRRVTLREPEVLRRLREESRGRRPGNMQIGPEQGQFLHLMARILGAKKTLEVGVLKRLWRATATRSTWPAPGARGARPASRTKSICGSGRRSKPSMRCWPMDRRARSI